MSVIQTIRNKYGKIAGAIIAVALIGFIISDARNGSFGNFFGTHDSNVMNINGSKIDPKEYQSRISFKRPCGMLPVWAFVFCGEEREVSQQEPTRRDGVNHPQRRFP